MKTHKNGSSEEKTNLYSVRQTFWEKTKWYTAFRMFIKNNRLSIDSSVPHVFHYYLFLNLFIHINGFLIIKIIRKKNLISANHIFL